MKPVRNHYLHFKIFRAVVAAFVIFAAGFSLCGAAAPMQTLWPVIILTGVLGTGLMVMASTLNKHIDQKIKGFERSKQQLEEKATLLHMVTQAADAGIWDYRIDGTKGIFKYQWFEMIGLSGDGGEMSRDEFKTYVHPEDWPGLQQRFFDHIAQGGNHPFEIEFRLKKSDGSWCWFLSKGKTVEWDENQVPVRIIGMDLSIQNLKETQARLVQTRQKYQELFTGAPIPLVNISKDGTILEINRCFTRTLGYTHDDIPDLEQWWPRAYPDTEYRKTVMKAWSKRIKAAFNDNQIPAQVELTIACKNKTRLNMLSEIQPIGNCILVSLVDITAMRAQKKALQENMEVMRAIFNATRDGILVVGTNKNVIQANQQFYSMWQIPEALKETTDEMKLRTIARTQVADPETFEAMIEKFYAGHLPEVWEIQFKDNRVFECYCAPIAQDGKDTGRVWSFKDISKLKQAQRNTDFERRQFLAISNSMEAFVYVSDTKTHEILFANQHLLDVYGHDVKEKLCYEAFHGLDQPCAFCTNPIILNNGKKPHRWEYHNKLTHSDVDIIDQIIRWPDGRDVRLEMAFDITERKKAEQQVQQLQNYLSNIIDSMPSILAAVDPQGRITQWNRKAEQASGISVDKALTRKLSDIFPHLAGQVAQVHTAIDERRVLKSAKLLHQTPDGPHYEDVTIFPLVEDQVKGAVIRVDDVTERVRLEEMMIQNEKMLSVGGLAAGMAHEINNPLAGVIQSANVLYRRLTDKQMPANVKAAQSLGFSMDDFRAFIEKRGVIKMLEAITDSGNRIAGIVDNMLNFARKSDSAFSSHDPSALLDKVLTLAATDYDLKKHYDFKSIRIEKEYEENLPMIPCDSGTIQQVILNILNNGAHAMFENVTPKAPCFILRICVERDVQMLRMEIQDNGPGMDSRVRDKIFEPFYTTKPVGIGTGLGLSISYFIITENHGGTLEVESAPGKGTTFIIRLPLTIQAPA